MKRISQVGKGFFSCTVALAILEVLLVWLALTGAAWGGVTRAWVANYNGLGNGDDFATAMAVDGDGNVYVTGYSLGDATGDDYATVKYNSDGEELWAQRYDGPGNGGDRPAAIALDSEGNVYVTGYSYNAAGNSDFATIKYSSGGVRRWVKRYNGPGSFHDDATAMAVDSEGNVYVTGASTGGTGHLDYATIKYNSAGDRLWVRRYNGPAGNRDWANAIAVDSSGNVYVTGESWSANNDNDYVTIKYDTDGDRLWVRRYNGAGNGPDSAKAIAVNGDGDVYVTGASTGANGNLDYATIRYNTDGDRLWVRRYNGPGNDADEARALALDGNGNVYVTGYSTGDGTGSDYTTIKYSPGGAQRWSCRYNGTGNGADEARAIAVDGDGSVYVTGYTRSTDAVTGEDYATIKYGTGGDRLWVRRYNGVPNIWDQANAIAVDSGGSVYVTGYSFASWTADNDYATIKYTQTP